MNHLKNLSLQYEEKLFDVTNWLNNLEDSISNPEFFKSLNIGLLIKIVFFFKIFILFIEQRLNNFLLLKHSIVENQSKIDNFNNFAKKFVDATVNTNYYEKNQAKQEEKILEIQKK